jgi:pyridoxamine 5'-phosphate oxidase
MSRQPDHPFFTDPDEPIARFEAAFERARRTEGLPEAVNVATVSPEGRPGGFVFYTNLGSRKAEHLRGNQHVALCF